MVLDVLWALETPFREMESVLQTGVMVIAYWYFVDHQAAVELEMVYLMVAPFPVVLADYQTALENSVWEKAMLDGVQEQLGLERPI